MTLKVTIVPCLADNYAYLIHNEATGDTALVDAPEPAPIITALRENGWTLTEVLLTHHHWDHVDGLGQILDAYGPVRVMGAKADAHRLPTLDTAVSEGDITQICGELVEIIDVSGHTMGHIAFHFPKSKIAFTGDSLMSMGCGRLSEAPPDTMWQSLCKLAALPRDTMIYSGHEYTQSNINFALTIEPDNPSLKLRKEDVAKAVQSGTPTAAATLATELDTNPFLRASLPEVKAAIGMADATDSETFTEIRARKDRF